MSGEVRSTEEGINHIRTMQNVINGGLMESLNTLISNGDSLNPGMWAGGSAEEFYSEWPTTKSQLNSARAALEAMANDIMSVNTNIQTAGGNA